MNDKHTAAVSLFYALSILWPVAVFCLAPIGRGTVRLEHSSKKQPQYSYGMVGNSISSHMPPLRKSITPGMREGIAWDGPEAGAGSKPTMHIKAIMTCTAEKNQL
jgi:hypothetical protein